MPDATAAANGPEPVAPVVRQATDAAAEPARLRLDALLTELMERAGEVLATQGRLRSLLDAVVSIAEDLSLQAVLQRIVDAACELVDARYGALGVVSPDRRSLTDFITVGLSPDEVAAIGHLPSGKGILGIVIDEPRPLLISRLGDHPKSYGFPPGHPPMSTFLGVPVRIRDTVFGNLYLTEKAGGKDFTEEDQQLVTALAAAAGVAIQNAVLFDAQQRRQTWLTASTEVRTAILSEASLGQLLGVIVEQCRTASGARSVIVALPNPAGDLAVQATVGPDGGGPVGYVIGAESPLHEAIASRSPLVIPDVGELDDAFLPKHLDEHYGRAVVAPLGGDETVEPVGILVLAYDRRTHLLADDVDYIAGFAGQVAVALTLARVQRDRERLVVLEDRDRIARDLHDLVIQRLFATGMTLQSTVPLVADQTARTRLTTVVDDLDATIRDLRQAIYQLQAETLDEDLRADIQRLIDEAAAASPAQIRLHLVGLVASAVPDTVRTHLLAVLREALSNAVRHSGASTIDVTVEVGRTVMLVVDDDGVGIDPQVSRRSGLANIQARAAEFAGSLDVTVGERGVGTRLTWRVPLGEDA